MVDGPNVYLYVGNNPVNLIDPDGLCIEEINDLKGARELAQKYLTRPGHNDIRDARRHAEYSKDATEKYGEGTASVAGIGHEVENICENIYKFKVPNLREAHMDLNNNLEGRAAAVEGRDIKEENLTTINPPSNQGPY